MRGEKDRHEAFQKEEELQQETRPVGAQPASLNVTQAAVHKKRWREEITEKNLIVQMLKECKTQ